MQLNSISAAFTQLLLMFNKNPPKYSPIPLSMLEYNITITHSNRSVLYNIGGLGGGGGWEREAKERSNVLTFPTLLAMIVVQIDLVKSFLKEKILSWEAIGRTRLSKLLTMLINS